MAKRLYFGWAEITKKETGKKFRMLTFGENSEFWHGIEVKSRFLPDDVVIPDGLKPGTMLDVIFDDRGNIEEVSLSR